MSSTGTDTGSAGKTFRYTIGFKMISIVSLILVISLVAIITIASLFFRNDNKKRIDENNLRLATVTALTTRGDFSAIDEKARFIASTHLATVSGNGAHAEKPENFLSTDEDILYIALAGIKDEKIDIHADALSPYATDIQRGYAGIYPAIQSDLLLFKECLKGLTMVHNASGGFNSPVIMLGIPRGVDSSGAPEIIIVYARMRRFLEIVRSPDITKTFIVNGTGELLAHYDSSLIKTRTSMSTLPIVDMMKKSSLDNGLMRYRTDDGSYYLGSFKKTGYSDTAVIATVPEARAYEAVYRILKRNILITIITLTLSIMVIYFFARSLTTPIRKLVDAARRIETGDFLVSIDNKPGDEIGLLAETFEEMGRGLAEREKMKDAFGKFVSKEIAELVLRDEIKLGGERKTATIFFSDIRAFTAMSEKLEPEEVVEFLNDYMTRMVKCINATYGVVDKFIGDAIMAVWGTPVSRGNDTENAIDAALMMRAALQEFNRGRGGSKRPVVRIGCGINTGPVLAGQIGSQERMEYTVIGDTVNLASRVETLTKPFGTDILISQDAYDIVSELYSVVPMQKIRVKGKSEPQQVYAVLGKKSDPSIPKTLKQLRKLVGIDEKDLPDLSKFNPDADEKKYEADI